MPPAAPRPGVHVQERPNAGDDDPRSTYDPLLAFGAILERSNLNVTVFDRELTVRDVSRAAAGCARLTREEMVGSSLLETMPPACHPNLARVLAGETVDLEEKLLPDLCPHELWTRVFMFPVRDPEGRVRGGMSIVEDVSELKHAGELLERLASFDAVTGLPNRTMLIGVLDRTLSGAKAKRRQLALVWINVDRFKDVNDAFGHGAGDGLLRAIGERLCESVRANDLVAHVGGDEFALLLSRANSRHHLEGLIRRVRDVFTTPFIVEDEAVFLTGSCGVAVHANGGADAPELLSNAQAAMRIAKRLGGGACEICDEGVTDDPGGRLRLAGEIRDGIEREHFRLHYQPQVRLKTMSVQAVEALARWEHPERGLLSPGDFIGFAEETGLIVPLGKHLLERACRHHRRWHVRLEEPPRLAVNISAREFQRTDVCGEVRRVAEAAGIPASSLEVEITETAVLADPAHAAEVAACLRNSGVTIALDDFGTGYSSLTHLRELPIDRVKIDRSFVASCLTDRTAAAILVGITHIAHDLSMEIIAEGVETQAQLDFLRAIGCDAAQGYHLTRPLTPDDCMEYLVRAARGPVL